jgi:hypothetical protein
MPTLCQRVKQESNSACIRIKDVALSGTVWAPCPADSQRWRDERRALYRGRHRATCSHECLEAQQHADVVVWPHHVAQPQRGVVQGRHIAHLRRLVSSRPYSRHVPTLVTSLLSSRPYSRHVPTLVTSLLSSRPYSTDPVVQLS